MPEYFDISFMLKKLDKVQLRPAIILRQMDVVEGENEIVGFIGKKAVVSYPIDN